jgi:hypothetical protein
MQDLFEEEKNLSENLTMTAYPREYDRIVFDSVSE